jgi:TolB protein
VQQDGLKIGGRSDWSPDGNWLTFYAGSKGERNIYIVGIDGKNLRALTEAGDNLAPSFSPDSKWIVFTSFQDGNNEIYAMRIDGEEIFRMTTNPDADWQPRWGQ